MIKEFYSDHYNAVEKLLSRCDGANAIDGQGFNKLDTNFARSLYKCRDWTSTQALSVHKMLKKYRNQLSDLGIDYNSLTEPNMMKSNEPDPVWTASLVGDRIELFFQSHDSNKFYLTLNEIKDMPSREWHKDKKVWSIPLSVNSVEWIKRLGFVPSDKLKSWHTQQTSTKFIKEQEKKFNPEKLANKLSLDMMYPFQKEGLAFIQKMEGRVLIGDEMGLGKTLQALAWLKLNPGVRPAIVVVPASLKINWQREADKWIQEQTFIVNGSAGSHLNVKEQIFIINYDIVANKHVLDGKDEKGKKKYKEVPNSGWIDYLKKLNPQCVVLDECHRIKNNKALRTKAVKKLCKGVPHVICLSGTAILNRPIEIFNAINILQPIVFPNYYRFGNRYCDAKNNGFGMTYNGATRTEELHNLLIEHVMIRRKKMDVLKQLPEKRKQLISFEINNRKEYTEAENDVIRFIYEQKGKEAAERASRAEVLARFNQLKQLSAKGKMDNVVDWVEDFLSTDQKLVVFAIHKAVVQMLMDKFPKIAVKIDGSCSQRKRQKSVDDFQNNEKIKLFVGNIQAASEGITLTASSNVVFIELAWSPALHLQAEDRVHRIGQNDACMAYYLLANRTIEEDMAKRIDEKQKIIDAVLDGTETDSDSLLTEMIKKFEQRSS